MIVIQASDCVTAAAPAFQLRLAWLAAKRIVNAMAKALFLNSSRYSLWFSAASVNSLINRSTTQSFPRSASQDGFVFFAMSGRGVVRR